MCYCSFLPNCFESCCCCKTDDINECCIQCFCINYYYYCWVCHHYHNKSTGKCIKCNCTTSNDDSYKHSKLMWENAQKCSIIDLKYTLEPRLYQNNENTNNENTNLLQDKQPKYKKITVRVKKTKQITEYVPKYNNVYTGNGMWEYKQVGLDAITKCEDEWVDEDKYVLE